MKVKTILGRIYYIIVAVCVFLHVVILSLSFFDNKHQEKYCRSIIPDREYQTDEDNRRFVFSAQKIKDGGDCLRFYTAHMERNEEELISYLVIRDILISVFSFLTRNSRLIAMRWHKNWLRIKWIKTSLVIFRIMNFRSDPRIWKVI